MRMDIVSTYLREQRRYTKSELQNLLKLDEKKVENFIKQLKSYYVLKAVRNNKDEKDLSDLLDEDIIIADETDDTDKYLYVFTFVGVISIGNRILKIYPKYLLSDAEPATELKQVLKVLEKYNNSEEQIINLYNGTGEAKSFNLLSVILYLMHDYYEFGLYTNNQMVMEKNGSGDIQWQKTIDETFPIIVGNRPIYTVLYTRKVTYDDDNYFRRLHRTVLMECSRRLEKAQLLDMFDIDPLYLTEEEIEDFGDEEYILNRILKELNIQFNTRNQVLLKTIYVFIAENKKMTEFGLGISMFGTPAFNMVWEKVCSQVFNNQLQSTLGSIPFLKRSENSNYDKMKKLIDVIEKPEWIPRGMKPGEGDLAKNTLIPDLITFQKTSEGLVIIILDAKYYNLQMGKDKKLRGQPGIESVTKQYLYELAYRNFANKHGVIGFRNCFILPTEKNEIVNTGYVELEMLHSLGLQNIEIRLVPAARVFQYYLSNRKMDISELELG